MGYHTATLSLPYCYTVTLPYCYTVTLPYYYTVPITSNRQRYTSLKKYLANVPELYPKNVPITLRRERYTNVTCEGLTRHEARLAPPDSLVERPRSGITCYCTPSVL